MSDNTMGRKTGANSMVAHVATWIFLIVGVAACASTDSQVRIQSDDFPQPLIRASTRADALVIRKRTELSGGTRTRVQAYWCRPDAVEPEDGWSVGEIVRFVKSQLEKQMEREAEPIRVAETPEWLRHPIYRANGEARDKEKLSGYTTTACIVSLDPVVVLVSAVPVPKSLVYTVGVEGYFEELPAQMLLPAGVTYGDACPWNERMWIMIGNGDIKPFAIEPGSERDLQVSWGRLLFRVVKGRIVVTGEANDARER